MDLREEIAEVLSEHILSTWNVYRATDAVIAIFEKHRGKLVEVPVVDGSDDI